MNFYLQQKIDIPMLCQDIASSPAVRLKVLVINSEQSKFDPGPLRISNSSNCFFTDKVHPKLNSNIMTDFDKCKRLFYRGMK